MLIVLIYVQVSLRELQSCNAHLFEHVTDGISVIYAPDVQHYFPWILIKQNILAHQLWCKIHKKCFVINGLWPSTIKGFSLKCIIKMTGACGSVHT